MYNTPQDLLDALRAAPDIYTALLRNTTQAHAAAARGGDEGWSVVEVICHLRDAEERALERMRHMRDHHRPLLPAYDQERWAIERNYAAADLQSALTQFLAFRAAHIADLAALAPTNWDRIGRHEELGDITLTGHTLHIVSHDMIHAAQIARQLASTPPPTA